MLALDTWRNDVIKTVEFHNSVGSVLRLIWIWPEWRGINMHSLLSLFEWSLARLLSVAMCEELDARSNIVDMVPDMIRKIVPKRAGQSLRCCYSLGGSELPSL